MIVTILIIAFALFVYIPQIRRYDIKDPNDKSYDDEYESECAHNAEEARKKEGK